MDKLKKQIIQCFLICAFGIALAESIIDSVFDDVVYPNYASSRGLSSIALVGYGVITIAIFIVGAFIFYKLITKRIDKEELRQLNEQSMIYASIGHDLKTPMTSVQGFAKAMMDDKIKPEEQKEIASIIYHKSCYMNELTTTLFTYAKMGAEGFELNKSVLNLCKLVREIVAEHYMEFEDKEIELEIEIPETEIEIHGDKQELTRAVRNLITNAKKYNCKGSKVLVRVFTKKNTAYIEVADTGEAIDKEMQDDIFNPFVSTNKARTSEGGTGLGLAIAKKIMNLHGGELYLDNKIEGYTKGFVMVIELWDRKTS